MKMKHSKPVGLVAALALGYLFAPGFALAQGGGGGGDDRGRIAHEFYIRVTPETNIADLIADLEAEYPGVVVVRRDDVRHLFVVRFPAEVDGVPIDDDVAELEFVNDPRVIDVDYHREFSTPIPVTQSFFLREQEPAFDGQEQSLPLGLVPAHLIAQGAGVTVAVIDTGVWPHPRLASVLLPGYNLMTGQPGAVDDGVGDRVGHGTLVAGLVHLVAPQAMILPLKVMGGDGMGTSFDIEQGIYRAIDARVDVINLSLTIAETDVGIERALSAAATAGIVVVAAMGNGGDPEPRDYPAIDPTVIAVAAVTNAGALASFTNWGEAVALCAPGVSLVGPFSGAVAPMEAGPFLRTDGTSLSSPLVAGAAALIRSRAHGASPARVRTLLRSTATNIAAMNPGAAGGYGAGMLNVGAVMAGTCASDFDASGSVDPDDLADFISAYFIASPAADADGSGAVDPDDLADFISRYFSADPCG